MHSLVYAETCDCGRKCICAKPHKQKITYCTTLYRVFICILRKSKKILYYGHNPRLWKNIVAINGKFFFCDGAALFVISSSSEPIYMLVVQCQVPW